MVKLYIVNCWIYLLFLLILGYRSLRGRYNEFFEFLKTLLYSLNLILPYSFLTFNQCLTLTQNQWFLGLILRNYLICCSSMFYEHHPYCHKSIY